MSRKVKHAGRHIETSRLSRLGPFLLLAFLLLPALAQSHLAIIRQGPESSGSPEVGDRMGGAVAAGDFNGDGYEDLATGAPLEDIDSETDAGVVVINWGSEFGLTHVGAVHFFEGDVGGSTSGLNQFGAALVAADFNADGIDDLAIGAPYASVNGNSVAGKVYVLRGTSGGLTGWLILTQNLLPALSAEAGDRFGFSLTAANFDQDPDGYDDLVVGSPGENADAGIITQFRSSAGGVGSGGMTWFDEAVLGGTNAAGNRFGYALAAGNVVYGAEPDLVVSAPWYDDPGPYGGEVNIGRVYAIKGMAGVGIIQFDATFYQSNHCDQSVNGGNFGYSLAVGRFRSLVGGYDCVAVGEPNFFYWDPVADFFYDESGRVVILPGGAEELDVPSFGEFYKADWTPVTQEYEHFGTVLTAGPFNGDDGYDDLVVGSPDDGAWDPRASTHIGGGCVFVGYGAAGGLGSGPANEIYSGFHLNDQIETGDELGAALCMGRWCADGRYGIAAGAPGEDDATGQVHVIAPWRQTYGLGCRTALSVDCNDNYIYALKPFDQVHIASTTKIMTILLAAEHSQLPYGHPDYVGLYNTYTVPYWACHIPGSRFHFGLGETMSLRNLMHACLLRSGNDAAHAIADMIHGPGDPAVTVPAFAAEMNAKAAALGMTGTHFHNPAGLDDEAVGPDLGEHYSTAADMMTLCRAAMDNPRFAAVAGAVNFDIIRHFNIGGTPVDVPWTIHNIYGGVLNASAHEMTGIKGGSTPKAQATGCFAAENSLGDTSLAGTFYTPFTVSDNECLPNALDLMTLAMSGCGYELVANGDAGACSTILPSIWSQSGERQGGGREITDRSSGEHAVSLCRLDDGADDGQVELYVRRNADVVLSDAETLELGIAPFDSHEGLAFTNMGDAPVQFSVTWDFGRGGTTSFDLEPGERGELAACDSGGAAVPEGAAVLTNTSGEIAHLGIEEMYLFNVTVPPVIGDPCFWQANVKRNGTIVADGLDVILQGLDFEPTAHLRAVIEDPRHPAGVGPDISPQTRRSVLSLRPPYPNPFSGETSIAFDLARGGEGRIRFFDARGRRVRSLARQQWAAGSQAMSWNGRDDQGRALPKGVYFFEIRLDGHREATGKLVLLR